MTHIVDFHVEGFARLEQLWPGHFDTLAAADEPGRFTVFPGYEIHSLAHGDLTIVYRDLKRRPILKADTPRDLKRMLRAEAGDGAMAFPHHIGYRLGARGIDWSCFDEELSPVLEIVSMHGCSETSLTDRPFLHSMGPSDGTATVRAGLSSGHRFGFLGNTDHHSGYPGSYGHGRSVILAAGNERSLLWEAIQARRTGALTGDNIHLMHVLGGALPGSTVAPDVEPMLRIEAVAGGQIDYIDIIRSGRLLRRITPEIEMAPAAPSEGRFETILVLEFGWGSRGSAHRWQGSLTVEGGEVLSVETRLRGAEVVSPLEGVEDEPDEDFVALDGRRIDFSIAAAANPNNMTPAMQAIALRVRLTEDARFLLEADGQLFAVPSSRLLEGAFADNIGPIDSPAFRFHPLPRPHQWQWRGYIALEPLAAGEWIYTRLRQANGQWAWTSPIFCR